ncbi:oligogalacturonate-specific porin KdgM family protein [Orbus mooreae]|uniref:oligogalacturonate-specific porin KdgM family protein n=1 Tax=Orbus mooreae TaxID=3074107 RepID=UPI00370D892D
MIVQKKTYLIKTMAIALSGIGFLALPMQSFAAGAWVEARQAYFTATDTAETAFKAGYNFDNGLGLMVTNAYNTSKFDQFSHSWNEFEGWYPLFKITPAFTIAPGLILTSTSAGSTVSGYVDFKYRFTDDFNVTTRYRYNHRNYDTMDLNKKEDKDDTHQIVMYFNYRINESFDYTLEPDYFYRVNDFHSANGKDYNWQINNKLTYNYDKHWKPYIEASWLDRVKSKNSEQYRFRIGVRYNL